MNTDYRKICKILAEALIAEKKKKKMPAFLKKGKKDDGKKEKDEKDEKEPSHEEIEKTVEGTPEDEKHDKALYMKMKKKGK